MADASLWSLAARQAWQLAALVVAVAFVSRLIARNRPHLAHAMWLVVLLKCVTPPVWSSPTGVFCWMRSVPAAQFAATVDESLNPAGDAALLAEAPADAGALLAPSIDVDWPVPAIATMVKTYEHSRSSEPAGEKPGVAKRVDPFDAGAALVTIWIVGSIIVVAVASLRMLACWCRVRRSGVRRDPQLDKTVVSLVRRLGIRRGVRLVVTESRVGPAVFGLMRPTILLPACVAAGRTAEELEPILAHELIHIRRGDLWIGLLEVIARCVWWFHPLVWLAGRAVSREAERCCDEEVIGSLGYAPARYARSLLDVLELKRVLVAVPAFPGVRPVELTSKRLERIMSLGQGCRRRASWRHWCVLLGVAGITLPGAALVAAAPDKPTVGEVSGRGEDGTEPASPAVIAKPATGPYSSAPAPTADAAPAAQPVPSSWITKDYDVADLIDMFRRTVGVNEEVAKKLIGSDINGTLASIEQFGLFTHDAPAEQPGLRPDRAEPVLEWSGQSLRIRYSPAGHRRIALVLADIRQRDYTSQICIEVRWVSLGRAENKLVEVFGRNWKLLPCAPSDENEAAEADDIFPPPERARQTHASFAVERSLPVLYDLLDPAQVQAGLASLERDPQSHWLSAPKVTTFAGQTAVITDVTQTPFMVDFRDAPGQGRQPVIRVCNEGTALRVKARKRGDVIRVDYEFAFASIGKVETIRLPASDGATLQVPETARTHFQSSVDLPLDKTLAIGGLGRVDDKGMTDQIVVLLSAKEIWDGPPEKVGSAPAEQPAAPDQPSETPSRSADAQASPEINRAADETPIIADVRIQGNRVMPLQTITPLFKTRPHVPLDKAVVAADVKRLMKTHRFVSIEPKYDTLDDGRVNVIFCLVERPTIRYVKILGSTKSEKTLAKKAGLKVGDPLAPEYVEEARTKLEEYLRAKAYANAKVTILEGTAPGDVGVRMLVSEGVKQKTWVAEFEGNATVPADKLTAAMWTKPAEEISTKGEVPIEGEVESDGDKDDVRRLTDHYRGLGFFRVRVGREFTFDKEQYRTKVSYVIDEGPRYVVTNVSVVGNATIRADQLTDILRLKAGDHFDRAKADRDVATIKDKYGERGYIFAAVQIETKFADEPGRLELVFNVTEGDQFRIGKLHVRLGDDQANRQQALLRALPLPTGAIANTRILRDCERRLKASAEFCGKTGEGQATKVVYRAKATDGGREGLETLVPGEELEIELERNKDDLSTSDGRAPGSDVAGQVPTAAGPGFGFVLRAKRANGDQLAAESWKAPLVLSFAAEDVDEERVTEQARQLTEHYQSLGFLNAHVAPRLWQSGEEPQRWTAEFMVDGGPRFVIAKVSFLGCKLLIGEELAGGLQLKVGDFLDGRRLKQDADALKAQYAAAGRPTPAVSTETRRLDEPNQVELVFKIAEDNPLAEQAGPAGLNVR